MSSRSRQRAVKNDTSGPSTTVKIDDATMWHVGRRGIQHEHLEQRWFAGLLSRPATEDRGTGRSSEDSLDMPATAWA